MTLENTASEPHSYQVGLSLPLKYEPVARLLEIFSKSLYHERFTLKHTEHHYEKKKNTILQGEGNKNNSNIMGKEKL
jgi:hypothetical protein